MRDGFYQNSNDETIVHHMQTSEGKQKGLSTILSERDLWTNGMKKADALEVLLQQPDFCLAQIKSRLTEVGEELGEFAMVDYYPKYHPELNFIEMYWGYCKRNVRKLCEYDFKSLEKTVPECLDSVPLEFIKKAARKSWRYIDCYFKGLTARQTEFAVKKYKSHRSLPPNALDDLQFD